MRPLALILALCALTAAGQARGELLARAPAVVLDPRTSVVALVSIKSLLAHSRARLVIEGLAYDLPPRVLYQVSFVGARGQIVPVGVIDFFTQSAFGSTAGASAPARIGDRILDAGPALASIGGQAKAVIFEAITGRSGGDPAQAEAGARVRFTALRIESD